MALPRYLLEQFGTPEEFDGLMPLDGPAVRRGIPRYPGMELDAPSQDEELDAMIGIDQPELDQFQEEEFDVDPLDSFLERLSANGVPQGLQKPQGFWQGVAGGVAQGAVGRGQRVTERRKKFEGAQVKRAAERDKANLEATQKYRDQLATGKRELVREGRDEARTIARETRAERRTREADARDNPTVTPEIAAAQPELARLVGQPVPRAWLKPESAADTAREQRRQFENDRDYGLRNRGENRQAAKDRADAANALKPGGGKPPSIDQTRAAVFAERGRKAVSRPEFTRLEDRIIKGGQMSLLGLNAPRMAQNNDQKNYRQAVESFALAFLREESMASIKDEEFAQVFRTFFAQPGENAETIRGKRDAREAALAGQEQKAARDASPSAPAVQYPSTWTRVE